MARLESIKRAKLKTAKQHHPSQKSKSLTCCYLLYTSFLGYPLPRSHRHGGCEKKLFPSTSYSFLFQIKAVAQMCNNYDGFPVTFCEKPFFCVLPCGSRIPEWYWVCIILRGKLYLLSSSTEWSCKLCHLSKQRWDSLLGVYISVIYGVAGELL